MLTRDGKELLRLYRATDSEAGLPAGEYIVEVDGNKISFKAEQGSVLEIKPQ